MELENECPCSHCSIHEDCGCGGTIMCTDFLKWLGLGLCSDKEEVLA